MKSRRRSRIDFPIEAKVTKLSSIDDLPEEFSHLLVGNPEVISVSDDDVEMVHQIMRLENMTVWYHDVFPRTALILAPYTDRKVISFRFLARNIILETMEDGKPYRVAEREITIYQVENTAPEIYVGDVDVLFICAINMDQRQLANIVAQHPELQCFLDRYSKDEAYKEMVDQRFIISKFAEWMMEVVSKFRGSLLATTLLKQKCAINMLLNVAAQFHQSHKSAHVPKRMQKILIRAVEYLDDHLREPIDVEKMAAALGTFPGLLVNNFMRRNAMTMEEFQFHQRMIKAFHFAANTSLSAEVISDIVGIFDVNILSEKFTAYFNCSIESLRSAQ